MWGMDHFGTYLQGQKFTLLTDYLPLEELGEVYSKTLNRLQKAITVTILTLLTKVEVRCQLTISLET